MSRFARKIDANQPEIVEALEDAYCEVLSLAPLGNGCADLLVRRCGHKELHLLEVKGPKGELTPDQREFHAVWPVTIVRTPEEALRAVGL